MYHLHIILTHSSSPLNIITVYNCKVIYTYFYICIQLHKAYTSFSRDEIQVHFYVKVLSKKKKKSPDTTSEPERTVYTNPDHASLEPPDNGS